MGIQCIASNFLRPECEDRDRDAETCNLSCQKSFHAFCYPRNGFSANRRGTFPGQTTLETCFGLESPDETDLAPNRIDVPLIFFR